MFFKISVLKKFEIFTKKTHVLGPTVFFYKVAGLKVCTFIKKRLKERYFSVNIVKFLRIAFDKAPLVAASVNIFIVSSNSSMNLKATYMEGVNEELLLLHCPYITNCL